MGLGPYGHPARAHPRGLAANLAKPLPEEAQGEPYVDEDVYWLFKSIGAGMGPRMNLVLGAFARARLAAMLEGEDLVEDCLLYTSPSPRDRTRSRMPSSA